jgi:hypothetical protein
MTLILLAIGIILSGIAGLLVIFKVRDLQKSLDRTIEDINAIYYHIGELREQLKRLARSYEVDTRIINDTIIQKDPLDPNILKRIDEQIAKSVERQRQRALMDLQPHEVRRKSDAPDPRTLRERLQEEEEENNTTFRHKNK